MLFCGLRNYGLFEKFNLLTFEGKMAQFTVSLPDKKLVNNRVDNMTISIRSKKLFDDTDFHLNEKNRYGLVGPNGHGKTSLLTLITEKIIQSRIYCCANKM